MIDGVPIFFGLSGLLIYFSLCRDNDFGRYLKNRFLRIYPELWLILILYPRTVLKDMILFSITQATVFQFWTPDSLRGYGIGTPNGALWTICVLVQFYLLAWFLYDFLKDKKCVIWIVFFLISIILSGMIQVILENTAPVIVIKLYNQTIIRYLWMFLIGMFIASFFEIIISYLMKYWAILLLLSVFVSYNGIDFDAGYCVFRTILMFGAVVGFAYRFPNLIIRKDISYGMYIYHGIIINIMFTLGMIRDIGYGILCAFLAIIAGWISYEVIGKIVLTNRKIWNGKDNSREG